MSARLAWGIAIPAAALAVWLFAPRLFPGRSTGPIPHPAATVPAWEARRLGLLLAGKGQHLASLPYFRRVAEDVSSSWADRVNYASAIGNGAQEGRRHLGKEEPAIRSSVERIAMTRLSLATMDEAEGLAPTRPDRATVISERARSLFTWGFVADALVEYRRAGQLDPNRPDVARTISSLTRLLESGGREDR
jgi:hypothetical protein